VSLASIAGKWTGVTAFKSFPARVAVAYPLLLIMGADTDPKAASSRHNEEKLKGTSCPVPKSMRDDQTPLAKGLPIPVTTILSFRLRY
jgi:hypothetical protein